MQSALIIPIYNEGERIRAVIEAGRGSPEIGKIIAIDDGSTDNTSQVLSDFPDITVLTHSFNEGKGEALDTGIGVARDSGFDTAVFLDGDLHGIESRHIGDLIAPLHEGSLMSIGYLGLRKAVIKNAVLSRWGALSGQRAIRTEIWDLLGEKDKHGFNIEAGLNARLRKNNLHHLISRVALDGVGHVGKRVKEDSWPKAIRAYSRTYSTAMRTYMRIELEATSGLPSNKVA